MSRRECLLVVLAACGTVNRGKQPDAGQPDGPAADGSIPCSARPFAAPRPLSELDPGFQPWLSPDEKTIYYTRMNNGLGDILVAQRTNGDAFGTPAAVTAVNEAATDDGSPTLSADGLEMILCSDRPNRGQYHLWRTTRLLTTDAFATPQLMTSVNDMTAFDCFPTLRNDGLELIFTSNRTGSMGSGDLFHAAGSMGAFGTATALASLNTQSDEVNPVLTQDGLTIFFASNRPDSTAKGAYDIWTAHRPALDQPFGVPTAVTEVNSADNDYPGWISADGCRLYMARRSDTGEDLFVAERVP